MTMREDRRVEAHAATGRERRLRLPRSGVAQDQGRRDRGAAGHRRPAAGLGALPALNGHFLTAGNLVNLLVQAAVFSLLAMGEVFVLLLGEIDLSVGFVAGLGAVVLAGWSSPGRLAVVGGDRWPRWL